MSCEYRTVVNCTDQLETALRPPDTKLVHFLEREGFISEEVYQAVLKPGLLNDHQKACQLVAGIRREVKLSPQKYYRFTSFLKKTGRQYESILAILDEEYWEAKTDETKHLMWSTTCKIIMFITYCLLITLFTIICILLVQRLLPKLNVLLYGGTGIYSAHLKKLYSQHKVFSGGGKWPATEVKEFINLAVVSYTPRDQDKKRKYLLQGNIEEMVTGKESIELDNIFKSEQNEPLSLILVEGAPGVGKSTLVWELCRRWGNDSSFMKHFSLVVLHRLRDIYTHNINSVRDLFNYDNEHIQQLVSDEVTASHGKGVLFLLDGFDEFLHRTSGDSYLIKLITKQVLPESTVLVTTRPAARATFFYHGPPVARHIEILGFTQEQVEKFTFDEFADSDPEILENFLREASENPVITSLMYIPLNAVIIIDIYKSNGRPIPRTQTQLYKELCLTQIRRHLISNDPLQLLSGSRDIDQLYKLDEIEDLSEYNDFYIHFQNLSQLAFNEFINENVIFYTLPSGLDHFGLLDKAPALYGRGQASYNFMHLTIQEFLVAYHIVCHDSEKRVFQEYGSSSQRWNLVWKFVAGLSKFKYYENSIYDPVFVDPNNYYFYNGFEINVLFMVCLFEAEVVSEFNIEKIFEKQEVFHATFPDYSVSPVEKIFEKQEVFHATFADNSVPPVDMYASGYFLVNTPSTATFKATISLYNNYLQSFVRGLKSVHSCKTNSIHSLEFVLTEKLDLTDFPSCILHHLSHLGLLYSNLNSFDHAVLLMENLKSLEYYQFPDKSKNLPSSLSKLFHPQFGSLKTLEWLGHSQDASILDILFGPTSLETLKVSCCVNDSLPSFDLLSKNKNLKNLTIYMTTTPPLDSLMTFLKHNTALQTFDLYLPKLEVDCDSLKPFVIDFLNFSKFQSLELRIIVEMYPSIEKDYSELKVDPRVAIKCVNFCAIKIHTEHQIKDFDHSEQKRPDYYFFDEWQDLSVAVVIRR